MTDTATPPQDVTLNVGDPTAHVHDWQSFGPAEGYESDADPIQRLACSCGEVGFGRGDFSAEARDRRRNPDAYRSVWTSVGPPNAAGVHFIKDQFGNENTCDCHAPAEDGTVSPDPGHEVTA